MLQLQHSFLHKSYVLIISLYDGIGYQMFMIVFIILLSGATLDTRLLLPAITLNGPPWLNKVYLTNMKL